MAGKLNRRSAWLLHSVCARDSRRFYLYARLPPDAPRGVSTLNVRALERAGFLKDIGNGIFEATEKAMQWVKDNPAKEKP